MIKRTKNLISFFICAFFLLSVSISAFADPIIPALIPALEAIGITIGGIGLTPALLDEQLGDPTRSDIPLPVGDSHVRVEHNAEIIDGVNYDAVWFSPQYAAYLKDEGLGWIADNSIDPYSQGTLAQGTGNIDGLPVFAEAANNYGFTQSYLFPFALGTYPFGNTFNVEIYETVEGSTTHLGNLIRVATGDFQNIMAGYTEQYYPFALRYRVTNRNVDGSTVTPFRAMNGAGWYSVSGSFPGGVPRYNYSPFQFDYAAEAIDTSQLDGESLRVLLPTGYLEDVQDGNYPITGGSPPTSPVTSINDALLDAILHLEDIISEFIEEIQPTPTPTPVPIPTDALGVIPTTTWMDIFGSAVKQGIQSINDTIGLFKQEVSDFFDTVGQGIQDAIEDVYDLVGLFKDQVLDTLDTWGQAIEDGLDDLGDIFNTGITSLRNILEAIRTAVATITSTLTDVLDHIKQGHIDLFQPVFDGIKIVFAPVLLLLKSALRLWHYVVEWVQATAPVFSTFFGFMSGTNYNLVLPIYAALAGPICIAIYKRFGR